MVPPIKRKMLSVLLNPEILKAGGILLIFRKYHHLQTYEANGLMHYAPVLLSTNYLKF